MKAIKFATKCLVDSQLSNDEINFNISITFSVGGVIYEYEIIGYTFLGFSEEMNFLEDGVRKILFSRNKKSLNIFNVDKELVIEGNSLSSFVIRALFPENLVSDILKHIFKFMNSIRYMDFLDNSKPSSVISRENLQRWIMLNRNGDLNEDVIFKILQMYFHDKDLFGELSSLLGGNGLGLLSHIGIENLGNDFYVVYFYSSEGDEFVFNNLSFGTRRVVHLLTSMLYDKASVALIEQPEDGIHPGLLQKIIQLLRDYANPNQFILTSHSPYVLNRLKPEEIRMVDMKEGKTRVRALDAKEIEIANDFIENEGALSEFIDSIEEL